MKRITATFTPLFIAFIFTVALLLAGCSASTVSGPDLDRQDTQTVEQEAPNADNNDGGGKGIEETSGTGSTGGTTNGGT